MAAVQERNDEMVDILSADFVRKTDSLWANGPQVKINVPGSIVLTIYRDYQYIVADEFDVIGEIDIIGELVII